MSDAKIVAPGDDPDRINRAIKMPRYLRSDDGRAFRIVDWAPKVPSMGSKSPVKITTTLIVSLPEDQVIETDDPPEDD